MALTDKQEMFCREYLIDLTPRKRPFGRGTAKRLQTEPDLKTCHCATYYGP